jgi:hypothetical protein
MKIRGLRGDSMNDTRTHMSRMVLEKEVEQTKAEYLSHKDDAENSPNAEIRLGARVFASHALSKLETLQWALKGMRAFDELAKALATIARLREALEPFAALEVSPSGVVAGMERMWFSRALTALQETQHDTV